MTFLELAAALIPGYEHLNEAQRTAFETSVEGAPFSELIQQRIEHIRQNSGFWAYFQNMFQNQVPEEKKFQKDKKALLQNLEDSALYQQLLIDINIECIKNIYPDFIYLNPEQQQELADQAFSHHFRINYYNLRQRIKNLKAQLIDLELFGGNEHLELELQNLLKERELLKSNWHKHMLESPEMENLHSSILANRPPEVQNQILLRLTQMQEHAQQLATFFPLLYYKTAENETSSLLKLTGNFLLPDGNINPNQNEAELKEISGLLFFCFKELNHQEMPFLNLDEFHRKQSENLAQYIFTCFNANTALNLNSWFKIYSKLLTAEIKKQIELIDGQAWQPKPPEIHEEVITALSFLWKSSTFDKLQKKIEEFADAHAFIQATGFSTQNESSLLAILDAVNYAQHAAQISEFKVILRNLLKPFLPLYNEYRHIALYENNMYLKAFKAMVPIVVAVGFILAASAVIVPLAASELAVTAAFIPTVLMGVALAAFYTHVKNDVFHFLRKKWHGGAFEIPEYKCNERMITAFRTSENALKVREFYITALKTCDRIENEFIEKRKKSNNLNTDDLERRQENIHLRHHLLLEWYDIHNNSDVAVDTLTAKIVMPRLQKSGDALYQILKDSLTKDAAHIKEKANGMARHFQDMLAANSEADLSSPTMQTGYHAGFFPPPSSFVKKQELEAIHSLQISL